MMMNKTEEKEKRKFLFSIDDDDNACGRTHVREKTEKSSNFLGRLL